MPGCVGVVVSVLEAGPTTGAGGGGASSFSFPLAAGLLSPGPSELLGVQRALMLITSGAKKGKKERGPPPPLTPKKQTKNEKKNKQTITKKQRCMSLQ